MLKQNSQNDSSYSFPQKVWITGSIFALIIISLLILKATFTIFLLVLAGTLIAVFFHGLSDFIEKKTDWPSKLALSISIVGSIIIVLLLFWLIGAKTQSQLTQLIDSFPKLIQKAKEQLQHSEFGQSILSNFSIGKSGLKIKTIASTFLQTTFGFLGNLYVILIAGIYLTASPHLYKNGLAKLAPASAREKTKKTLSQLGTSLKQWLKGKLGSMLLVSVLIAIGLKIIGLPNWLALALIAGILNFIPNFGPIIAAIPAILVSLVLGEPYTVFYVAGLYLVAQTLEGTIITPQIQQKMVSIPPALLIIAQVIITAITGFWGLVFAAPLLVIITVLVQELYVKRMDERISR